MDSKQYSHKIVNCDRAVNMIKNGSRVFIGTGCGEPQHLIHAMIRNPRLQDVMVYQMLSSTFSNYMDDDNFLKRFDLKLFFISASMRTAAFEGKIDYIPTYLSQIPALFYNHRIGLDTALIQVSPPDRFGYCSLGISVDITRAGADNAKIVIAQVNPRMPRTWGDTCLHIDQIDYLVLHEEPLVESETNFILDETAKRIGLFTAQLINDGATLQIGFGRLPNLILQFLQNKKNLGIHTQLITDALLPLLNQKVITNAQKNHISGRVVASLCMGSEKLYQYVNENPVFYFRSSDYVNDPEVIARNDNMIALSSALEVDLTGQVCMDSMGSMFYSGIGDQVDYFRGAFMSKKGFSIIALPSTANNGQISRIVPQLSAGAGVAATRADLNFIVTEYGIAELQGKSIYQRVIELTQIAHPKFREGLIEQARERHYIFADQLPPAREDLLFLEGYKSSFKLKNNQIVEFRPMLPSDELGFRNFFYSLQEETVYARFFYPKKIFSHSVVQKEWANVDYRDNMSLLALMQNRGHKEIIAIGSYARTSEEFAEVAFVTRENFQGLGIASRLLLLLKKIALENNFSGFYATVLKKNEVMLHIFKKEFPAAHIAKHGSEIEITMDFN